MKYHCLLLLFHSPYERAKYRITFVFLYYSRLKPFSFGFMVSSCINMEQIQVGSLAGAAQLLKDNAGVQRLAQKGQKPFVADKANSLA